MPFVRVHGALSDGRRLDCVVSDAPTAAEAFDGTILVGSEADAATGAAAEAAAAAVDANATDASAPAEACAVLSTDGSAHVHVGCEVEGGRWWIKARLEDGAWLLSRGEGYKVQNAVAGVVV
jgi:formylmethanofuran dehydrogenase subunit C